ncbi:ZNHI2 protein, partial [Podilymbus podiceps]|nr:ZNHI2 protein [Podilymbus podiceps]
PTPEPPCGLCGAAAAPYTCPRCNRRLCSLRCYRSHGVCAEAFYREQVLQSLKTDGGPPADGDRLAATFRRLRHLREAEDPPGPGGRDLWESLSPAERADFQRLVLSGKAAELLPPWRPWWWRGRRSGKESPGEEDEDDDEETLVGPTPSLPLAVPPLSSFPAPPPSPLLPFQLPNVLYGYAFALSLHGGDETLLPDLPLAALRVSPALAAPRPFASVAEALRAARRAVALAGYPSCPLGDVGTVVAVAELLEGRRGGEDGADVVAALAHLEELLRRGSRVATATTTMTEEERRRLGRARRKCRYLLAWCREAPVGTFAALAGEARRVHGEEAARGRGEL